MASFSGKRALPAAAFWYTQAIPVRLTRFFNDIAKLCFQKRVGDQLLAFCRFDGLKQRGLKLPPKPCDDHEALLIIMAPPIPVPSRHRLRSISGQLSGPHPNTKLEGPCLPETTGNWWCEQVALMRTKKNYGCKEMALYLSITPVSD